MKVVSAAVKTLIESGDPVWVADLYLISNSLNSGLSETSFAFRLTNWDQALTYGGNLWQSGTLTRGNTRNVAGLESDSLDVEVALAVAPGIGVDPNYLNALAVKGDLDGASLRLDRAYMSAPGIIVGTVCLFEGFVADISVSQSGLSISARSNLERLREDYPKNKYTPTCQHCIYDSGCGLDKTVLGEPGLVVAGGSTATVLLSNATGADGYYSLGWVAMTSGDNDGEVRGIRSSLLSGGAITLETPLPYTPDPGDTFDVFPGCARTRANCVDKYNNLANFRGYPYVPAPETAR